MRRFTKEEVNIKFSKKIKKTSEETLYKQALKIDKAINLVLVQWKLKVVMV